MGNRLKWLFRLSFLIFVLAAILMTFWILRVRWQAVADGYVELVDGGDSSLSLAERLVLQTYLSSHVEELSQPAGTGADPVMFQVIAGETADDIATNLAEEGLLSEPELFVRYVRYHGLDSTLEAGEYTLDPQLTIPELALALTQAFARDIELRFLEGWRLEEMKAYLEVTKPADIRANEFEAMALRQRTFELSGYDFLASLPAETTLEGFLFPDTYRVPIDANTAYLLDQMLQNFGRQVTPSMRQSFGVRGLSLLEAVTLASIVEREAVIPSERPLIAGVFFNRLAQGMKLEADPTTQYALGYQSDSETWWKSPLTSDDLSLNSPYNTYVASGLPPGPIANPGLSSLDAVANPIESEYLFFVADCTAEQRGLHVFSTTYEEHVGNVQRCR